MTTFYNLILLAILLVSCSTTETVHPTPVITYKPIIITPVRLITTVAPGMPTQQPTSTRTPTTIATTTSTFTMTPIVASPVPSIADCLPKNSADQKGIVTEVIDGDTIIVRLEDGNIYSVRYIGIDAAERDLQYFAEAYNANADLVLQKEVLLIKDVSDTDQYGRLLRYIVVGDVFVNQQLIEQGFARAMQYPPDVACAQAFSLAEQAARSSQVVIWVATPVPGPSDAQVVIVTVNKRQEYVDIQNAGSADVDLSGWNLVSERGHQECYLSGILQAGKTLRIWAGSAQAGGFSCGYSNPIWNNSEVDPAVLYNTVGVEVSRK
jgi:endonuclease YncB( thermonuclease family)